MKKNNCLIVSMLFWAWKRKLVFVMRLTFSICLLSVLQSFAISTFSQNSKLSIKQENISVESVIQLIQDQTDYHFMYSGLVVDVKRTVDLNIKRKSVPEILEVVFKNTDVTYKINGQLIALNTVRKNSSAFFQKQNVKISGRVSDSSGSPLPGVTVVIKGTTNGTVTNVDGEYSLTNVSEDATLVFSFVGMKPQEIPVAGKASINVVMAEETFGIDEVVAIGYGTQKKVNVIGSVAQVESDALTAAPVSNVSNSLAARMPGVIVQQRSGEPGNNSAGILIRGKSTLGNNSPLIIVDGIQGRDINSLNAEDIQSISVLKDASAAIYGARAANGVILVTTKEGQINKPISLTYGFYQGYNTPTMLPEMADASTYAQMVREAQGYLGTNEENMLFSESDIEKFKSGEYIWTHPNTDAYKEALAKFSGIDHHSLIIQGGTNVVEYYGSLGTQHEDGIYKNNATSFNRYNYKMNLDFKVNEYINIGLYTNGIKENKVYPTMDTWTIFSSIQNFRPTDFMEWPNGFPGPDVGHGYQPKVMTGFEYGSNKNEMHRSYNTLSANVKVPWIDGLSLSGTYSYDKRYSKNKKFETPYTLYSLDKVAYFAAGYTGKEDGADFLVPTVANIPEPRLTDSFNDYKNISTFLKVDYTKTFNDVHNFSAFIAYESFETDNEGISAFRRYFISDQIPYLFAGGTDQQNISSSVGLDASVNYFGRLSYNYNDTYLLQFTFRRDGSLRFSEESGRWGNFPSIIVGYRPSNQDWWKDNIGFINYFKLKASYGQLGNDLISPFQYLASYKFSGGWVQDGSRNYIPGLVQTGVPNPLITWEVANMYNIGWESQFLNSKMTFDTDFFYERRSNILVKRQASVPDYSGITLPDENFGIVDNKGVELNLGYRDKIGDLYYNINGNFSFARNKIIEYDEPKRNVSWQQRTGYPQGAELVYHAIGVFKDEAHVNSYPHVEGAIPGDLILEDFDEDGKITADDQILLNMTRDPEITYGASFDVEYKNWKLDGLLQGVGRCQNKIYFHLQGLLTNYFQHEAEGRWTVDNINADKPRTVERESAYWRSDYMSDYYYHRMDYLRLKNLRLSYTIPKKVVDTLKMKNAQIYVSGQNLLLIYSANDIMDPETGFSGSEGGVSSYPVMKTYSLGVQVTF
ncbi:SusC/RagA family TonB-linked outer membrane protein [Mariniphaga sediminis]|uniref:SusC/RagA family TonB-linked outer membrane protein n=1 Tax=Mariniphaga sediminis TaxID=1628158 RepID=A0A399DA85_9BACT|nr:TonB-dependent receptor [Mariniphaga sediminis]RIH67101.1 SusC/RagA family TonB-linked outer membrane protein [Mariniphaga sediminis]